MKGAVIVVSLLAVACVSALDCSDSDAVFEELGKCLGPFQGTCLDGVNPIVTSKCCKPNRLPKGIKCLKDVLRECPDPQTLFAISAAEGQLKASCVDFKDGKTDLVNKKGKKAVKVKWTTTETNCYEATFTPRSGYSLRKAYAGVHPDCKIPSGGAAFQSQGKPKKGSKKVTLTICPNEISGLADRCKKKVCLTFLANVKSGKKTDVAKPDKKKCKSGKGGSLACSTTLKCTYKAL